MFHVAGESEHWDIASSCSKRERTSMQLRQWTPQASEAKFHAARREETRTGRPRYSIEFEALQKFCKEHRNLLITRRWPPQRIRFLEEYVFAPKHAELLRTRESKRENEAFDRGEYLDLDEDLQRRA